MGGVVKSVGNVIGSLTGANAQAQAAQNAAQTQAGMSQAAIDEQRRQFGITQQNLAPWMQAGQQGVNAYSGLAGLLGGDAQNAAIQSILAGPEFQALIGQAEQGILSNAAATGGLRGGNVQQALATNRTNLLGQLIGENLNRYSNLSGQGLGAATQTGNLGAQNASNVGNLLTQQGQALAGGQLAAGNAQALNAQSALRLGGNLLASFF